MRDKVVTEVVVHFYIGLLSTHPRKIIIATAGLVLVLKGLYTLMTFAIFGRANKVMFPDAIPSNSPAL